MTKSRKAPALQSRYQTNKRYDVKIETSSTVIASLLFTSSLHVSAKHIQRYRPQTLGLKEKFGVYSPVA